MSIGNCHVGIFPFSLEQRLTWGWLGAGEHLEHAGRCWSDGEQRDERETGNSHTGTESQDPSDYVLQGVRS